MLFILFSTIQKAIANLCLLVCCLFPVWKWLDRLDFNPFDQMVHDFSQAMPDAKLLCMIDMNSPVWLEHYMAFECCDSFNNLGKAVHNPFWLEAVERYLKELLHYVHDLGLVIIADDYIDMFVFCRLFRRRACRQAFPLLPQRLRSPRRGALHPCLPRR